jgi:glutathione S-transferase
MKIYKRDPQTHLAPPELKQVHPLGKSPVVTVNDEVLAESGHIIQWMVNKYGNGRLAPPADSPEYQKYNYWLHYSEGSAMPPLVMKLVFDTLLVKSPWIVKPIVSKIVQEVNKAFIGPQLKTNFDYMESELSKTKWFAGRKFTAADIQMSYPVQVRHIYVHLHALNVF